MAATAAILSVAAVGTIGAKMGAEQKKKDIVGINQSATQTLAAMTPPVIPKAPDIKQQQADTGLAMTQAALAARRKAAGAGGWASTVLTSPTGAVPAVTGKKTLLGL